MRLSIIIVNYNVTHFLEQCLHAVRKALTQIEAEVFVVDNNSVDGSCAMVKSKFPEVKLIENHENLGFSRANNQAILLARGEYVLLLNPDTVVQEDTFVKCLHYMDEHPEAGAMGVKMIDGKGRFLPESKRALPTPAVAFYKIFGLSRLFPRSKTFARYHLGYLDKDKTHEVEILSGAFMLMRKTALDKAGLLDETFFMYGEDIDLSYRILKSGFKVVYFADTTIIHYKGESTKKGSINYVLVFYNAMIIFAKKHFSQKNAFIFTFFIQLAIYFRAGLSIIKRFINQLALPLIDTLLISTGLLLLKSGWDQLVFERTGDLPAHFTKVILPLYTFIWLGSIYLSNGYAHKIKSSRLIKGILAGSLVILAIYALLPLDFRFSRMLVFLSSAWTLISVLLIRYILFKSGLLKIELTEFTRKRILICGNKDEAQRISRFFDEQQIKSEIVGFVSPDPVEDPFFSGTMPQLDEMIRINRINEIIFCARDISSQQIIDNMLQFSNLVDEYKIAPPESISIIGSNSINTAGDLYLINTNSITKEENIRNKRLFDLFASFLLLLLSPLLIWFISPKLHLLRNIFRVFTGRYSWVGYHISRGKHGEHLPRIKPGILSPVDALQKKEYSAEAQERINMLYAKDYKVTNDWVILFKAWQTTGR